MGIIKDLNSPEVRLREASLLILRAYRSEAWWKWPTRITAVGLVFYAVGQLSSADLGGLVAGMFFLAIGMHWAKSSNLKKGLLQAEECCAILGTTTYAFWVDHLDRNPAFTAWVDQTGGMLGE